MTTAHSTDEVRDQWAQLPSVLLARPTNATLSCPVRRVELTR
jgi:hypothetical protein